jgi:hypothetical protein
LGFPGRRRSGEDGLQVLSDEIPESSAVEVIVVGEETVVIQNVGEVIYFKWIAVLGLREERLNPGRAGLRSQ